MKELIKYLDRLENTSGTIAKEEILEDMLINLNSTAYRLITLVYEPIANGVKKATIAKALSFVNERPDRSDINIFDVTEIIENVKKLTGKTLIQYLHIKFSALDDEEIKWLCRVILKDLRIGIGLKTLNPILVKHGYKKIKKFAMQLCGKVDVYDEDEINKRIDFPCALECKYDGIRMQVEKLTNPEQVICTSRRGTDRTGDFPDVEAYLLEKFKGQHIILDGEIIGRTFQDTMKKGTSKIFVCFDLLMDESLPYMSRWDNLVNLGFDSIEEETNAAVVLAEHRVGYDAVDIRTYFEELNEREEEGIIIKLLHKSYKRDNRKNMYKCKKVYTSDLLCIGWNYGTGKRTNLVSSLNLVDASGKFKVSVGSGITDALSDVLTGMKDDVVGRIVEIAYNELTTTGSIRFPRFKCFRDDKEEPDDLSEENIRQA